MTFTLTIELGNDAMRTGRHIAHALTNVAERVRAAQSGEINRVDDGKIRDVNGNTVGRWAVLP